MNSQVDDQKEKDMNTEFYQKKGKKYKWPINMKKVQTH